MSDDWMNRLHPDMQKLLTENPDAVREATDSGHTMLGREVTNRDLELQQQAARIEALTMEDIRQNVDTPPGRDIPEGSRETWDYSEPNFAPRMLDESLSQAKEAPEAPEPEPQPNYDAMRAADHEQSEHEARLEREKPDEVKEAELAANYQDYLKDHPQEAEQHRREEEERQRREQERERGDE